MFLGRMNFREDDGYKYFLVFGPMLNSKTLDNNNDSVTNWISTENIIRKN